MLSEVEEVRLRAGCAGRTSGPTIGKGTRIGRVVRHSTDRSKRRRAPADLSKATAPRDPLLMSVEVLEHLSVGADLQKGAEDQLQTQRHLCIRVLRHYTTGASGQTDREGERPCPASPYTRIPPSSGLERDSCDEILEAFVMAAAVPLKPRSAPLAGGLFRELFGAHAHGLGMCFLANAVNSSVVCRVKLLPRPAER
jgi:hypothetical protein